MINQFVKTEAGEEGKEQEDASDTGAEPATRCQAQESAIGDDGLLGAGLIFTASATCGSPAAVRKKKGGGMPLRHDARKRQTMDFRAERR